MQHRVTITYTKELVAHSVRAFCLRAVGYGGVISIVFMLAFLVWRITDGDGSWVVGVVAVLLLISIAMPIALYVVHYRHSMEKLREMKQPVAELVADDEALTFSSDLGSSRLKWRGVTEVWRFQGFWLLLLSKSQFVTIPLDGVPEAMQSFVIERVKSEGGKIAD